MIRLTLAQEKGFRPGTPFQKRLSYDIPTRNPKQAELAVDKLRKSYQNMSAAEKRQVHELLRKTWSVLLQGTKNRRGFTAEERERMWKIALMYSAFRSELSRSDLE